MKTYPGIFRIVVAAFAADNIEPIGTCIAGCDGVDVAKTKLDDLLLCGLCIDDEGGVLTIM